MEITTISTTSLVIDARGNVHALPEGEYHPSLKGWHTSSLLFISSGRVVAYSLLMFGRPPLY